MCLGASSRSVFYFTGKQFPVKQKAVASGTLTSFEGDSLFMFYKLILRFFCLLAQRVTAKNHTAIAHIFCIRAFLTTFIGCVRTTRCELTVFHCIFFSFHIRHDNFFFPFVSDTGYRTHQKFGVRMCRIVHDLFCRSVFDQAATIQGCDIIGYIVCSRQVMSKMRFYICHAAL